MPGKVVKVLVAVGDEVKEGQGLVVIEAMKMENEVRSPREGEGGEVPRAGGGGGGAGPRPPLRGDGGAPARARLHGGGRAARARRAARAAGGVPVHARRAA